MRYIADKRNVIAANNPYDVEYIKYFTGYTPLLLRSYCNYTGTKYNPTRPGFLVPGSERDMGLRDLVVQEYNLECKRINCTVDLFNLRHRYRRYSHPDQASHQGLVYVPYQV